MKCPECQYTMNEYAWGWECANCGTMIEEDQEPDYGGVYDGIAAVFSDADSGL